MTCASLSITPGYSTGRDRDVRVSVSIPPAPFDLDTSHRDETAPRSTPIRRPWRQTTPHEPVFVRELRKAFMAERGPE